jgi:epoxyqueuosine reductase QueG
MAQKPESLRDRLKEAAERKGAVAFGIASVDDADALPPVKIGWTINRWTKKLRDTMPEARSVIVFGIQSTDDADEIEVQRASGALDYPGYLPISIIMRDLMRILRENGYRACAPSVYASHKRVAQLAGIGRYGKSSLIIHPKYGPWLRIGAVLTDAPLQPDKPFEEDLCGRCERCVRACPAGALEPYVVDPDRCLVSATTASYVKPDLKPLLAKYSPVLTHQSRVMCTQCQLSCRYTTAERRRNVIPAARVGSSAKRRKR